MSKKTLLEESTVRKFMKFANIGHLAENYLDEAGMYEEEEMMEAEHEGDEMPPEAGMEDEMDMEPHAGANNAYYSRKCARASLPNIDDLLAGVPPGTCPVCSIQEPIYRPQPLAPHENAPGKRACALQTKPSTQPPRTQPITKHRMLNRGASSTANTSAIFADISTGN